MRFPAIPEDLTSLTTDELDALHSELVAAFNETTAEGVTITDEDVAELSAVADGVDAIRSEQSVRAEAAAARAEQLNELASRVNPAVAEDGGEEADPEEADPEEAEAQEAEGGEGEEAEAEGNAEEQEQEEAQAEIVEIAPAPAAPKAVAASSKPAAKAVTAGATVAQLKRNAPIKTRPRQADPNVPQVTITAAADIPGLAPGQEMSNIRQVAEAMCSRFDRIGSGNSDTVPVARFNLNMPEDRRLSRGMTADQLADRLASFNQSPAAITAAGGLCAPVNSYYDQMVIADASRPVRDGLANFQADRGGIRYNPPPKLSSITAGQGVGVVTAAQDASNATKTPFTVTCPSIAEVDIASVYSSLLFGNIGARAFPEQVEAWTKLALATQARKAETFLLDGIAAASTPVTAAGLVGAGRELFARLGQAAAGYRSRNRMRDVPLRVMLPAWALDLVQTDFARTFTDSDGLISMDDSDITSLFGVRDLNPTWYLDSKTGGGQVFGAAAGGQTYSDGATNSNTTVTSATAGFTSADVGKTIVGAGIPAGATITVVGSATSVTISAAATATATGVTITVGRTTLAQFPSTVYAYMFPEGSFLHLDAGTLDLGLVRDSTLNGTNQFQMFSETFENVALVGPESLEIALSLQPTGTYTQSTAVTSPINS